jgi:hypothetical protein
MIFNLTNSSKKSKDYLPPNYTYLKDYYGDTIDLPSVNCMLLSRVAFDAKFYLKNNPDIQDTLDFPTDMQLWSHYISGGWIEGRLPFKVEVDDEFYLSRYPDIKNYDGTPQEHFIKHGYSEGRLPYPFELDINTYNKKLRIIEEERPLLTNESDMISHFIEKGYRLLF